MVGIQTGQNGVTVLRLVVIELQQGAVTVTIQRLHDLMQNIVQLWVLTKKQKSPPETLPW